MHKNYLDLNNYSNIAKMIVVEHGGIFVILDIKNM